jgi:hypothetical protein
MARMLNVGKAAATKRRQILSLFLGSDIRVKNIESGRVLCNSEKFVPLLS